MKSWFASESASPRAKAWKFAKSLRDSKKYPWWDKEVALAEAFMAETLDATQYRQAIYAATDWNNIKNSDDFGGYSQSERDHRADIIATMEIAIAQSERG